MGSGNGLTRGVAAAVRSLDTPAEGTEGLPAGVSGRPSLLAKTCAAPRRATEAAPSRKLARSTSLVTAGVLLAGLFLAACGGAPTSSSNGIASKSPDQIASSAASVIRKAKSVHLIGSYSGSTLDVYLYSNGDVSGSVSKSGLSFDILTIHTSATYVKASASFWEHGANVPAATASGFNNKWVKLPGSTLSPPGVFTIASLASALSSHKGKLSKVGTKTIDGQSVVGVHSTVGGTMWIATTGTPYPVELTAPSGTGSITLSGWNQSSAPSAPAHAIPLPSIG